MRLQVKSTRPKKGESRKDVRNRAARLEWRAENEFDERLLSDLFRVFADVGVGGCRLMVDQIRKEIDEAKAAREAGKVTP